MADRGSSNSRTQRIESQMQRVLASLLSRDVKDPRIGPLTVTQVTLAADMSAAKSAGGSVCVTRHACSSCTMIPSTAPRA